jgi:NAD(P)-dependent dehydrogenase (short-subunit alcohol dehydrogenase family)
MWVRRSNLEIQKLLRARRAARFNPLWPSLSDAYATQADLTRPANVTALFKEAKDRFGGIDIAVYTVGKVLRKPIVETTEEEYDSMCDINAKAAYFLSRKPADISTTTTRSSPS